MILSKTNVDLLNTTWRRWAQKFKCKVSTKEIRHMVGGEIFEYNLCDLTLNTQHWHTLMQLLTSLKVSYLFLSQSHSFPSFPTVRFLCRHSDRSSLSSFYLMRPFTWSCCCFPCAQLCTELREGLLKSWCEEEVDTERRWHRWVTPVGVMCVSSPVGSNTGLTSLPCSADVTTG